ncbi:hypothetical protein Gasu2_09350 [Galdieria sulphuraria]|nr:hypothetical protein Gasu2_09350 [Galdieria sulphuraria]
MQRLDPSLQVANMIKQLLESRVKMMEKQRKKIQYEVWNSSELTNTTTTERILYLLTFCEKLLKDLQEFRQRLFSQIQEHPNETCFIPSEFFESWSILMKELEECRLPPLLEHLERRQISKLRLDDMLQNLESCIAFVQRWKHVVQE